MPRRRQCNRVPFYNPSANPLGILYNKFKRAHNPVSKIKACLEDRSIMSGVQEGLHTMCSDSVIMKDATKSNTLRAEGNKMFAGPCPDSALDIYGEALRSAPPDSDEERLAYANRSAVFFLSKKFHDCLIDINRALPKSENFLKLKLLIRKAKALHHLGLKTESTVQEITECIESGHWGTTKDTVEDQVAEMKKELAKKSDHVPETKEEIDPLPEPLGGYNPSFPSASNFVDLRSNFEKGKHIVATKDFNVGDVIFVEETATQTLLPGYWLKMCQYCMKRVLSYMPCTTCNKVIFCGEECRNNAWDKFHKYECPQGVDLCRDLDVSHLALRMVVQNINFPTSLELVSNLNKRPILEQIKLGMAAVLLQFYADKYIPTLEADSTLGGRFLLILDQLYSNYQSINETQFRQKTRPPLSPNSKPEVEAKVIIEPLSSIGMGVFPAVKKMNHSCIANATFVFHGPHMVIRAIAPIKAGEEICECYDPDTRVSIRKERLELLKERFFFTCKCPSCSAPEDPNLRFSALQCVRCSGLYHDDGCSTCGTNINLNVMFLNIITVSISESEHVTKGNAPVLLKQFTDKLALARKLAYRDNEVITTILVSMAECFHFLENYVNEFSALYESLHRIKSRSGPYSVDVAEHFILILECSLNLIKSTHLLEQKEVLNVIGKAVDLMSEAPLLFELNYGTWSKNYDIVMGHINIFKHYASKLKLPTIGLNGNSALPDDP